MTQQEATALVTFIKDHDTRFEATAVTDEPECFVQLTQPEDGQRLAPVYTLDEYARQYVEQNNPSPTIHEKWAAWCSKQAGQQGA